MAKRKPARRRVAWRKAWDGGWMGMNGIEIVYQSKGKYSYDASDYGGEVIESDDLLTVLRRGGLNWANDAAESISSPLFSAEEVVKMLEVDMEVGRSLAINGEEWVCTAPGVLQRAAEDAQQ